MKPNAPYGIITPLAMPFTPDEQIDLPAFHRVIEHVVKGGVHGLFVLGTTGEFVSLTDDERHMVVEKAIQFTAGRLPVWVGITSCATRLSQAEARRADAAGACGVVVMPPYYYKMTETEIENHILGILDCCELPVVLYQNPKVGNGTIISPDLVGRLSQLDGVVGIKDSSDDLEGFEKFLANVGGNGFAILQGSEKFLLQSLSMGGSGGVSSLSNVFPEFFAQLYEYGRNNRGTEDSKWQAAADIVHRIYTAGPSLLASVKAAMSLQKLCRPLARRPFLPLNQAEMVRLQGVIDSFTEIDPSSTHRGE